MPSQRHPTTPYSTASSYVHPETRKDVFNLLMQVRKDPSLTLALSSVNKSTRARAKMPLPKNIHQYIRHAGPNRWGRYYNMHYKGGIGSGESGWNKIKASTNYRAARNALKKAIRKSEEDKKNRGFIAKLGAYEHNAPPMYAQLGQSIRDQFESANASNPNTANRNRYVAHQYPPAQKVGAKRRRRSAFI